MADEREYELAHQLLDLVDEMRAGATHSVKSISKMFNVQEACARRYLRFAELRTKAVRRTRNGRKVSQVAPDEDELTAASALELARVSLPWLQGTGLHHQLRKLAGEARSVLKEEQRVALDRVFGGMYVKRREPRRPRKYAEFVELLSRATRERVCVELEYTKLDGTTADYLMEPWSLALIDDALFVFGRKLPDGVTRSFEVSAVQACRLTNRAFPAPHRDESDCARVFQHSIGTYSSDKADPEEVVLRVRRGARALLERRPLHTSQTVESAAAGDWAIVRLRVTLCPELTASVLSLLPDIVVVSPRSLRLAVRTAAQAVDGSEWDRSDPSGIGSE